MKNGHINADVTEFHRLNSVQFRLVIHNMRQELQH